ncbi:peptide ABC transporter permease [Clostridium zeae]|uniref:Peptide ABC transporter permease n=1 Tax=Clostridium zeae TaxID=2759022 RepID=A0ABQ1E7V8_9CLOT|nr:FtsX-like permease family protein [Clostridium zeae]GFZ30865.1 peptide ABC transporter permease [Clostridium zeae]
MLINKRNIRDLRKNFIRHFGIFIFILISSMVMVGISSSIDSVISTVSNLFVQSNVEDGYFESTKPLSNKTLDEISVSGINIEDESYQDEKNDNGKVLRIFRNRSEINLLKLIQGRDALKSGEIVLSRGFAENNNYNIGEKIKVKDKDYLIVGYATTPDYVNAIREPSDVIADYSTFGLGYMYISDANDYFDSAKVKYHYSYRLNGHNKDSLSNIIKKDYNIISMVDKLDNVRITGYESDIKMIKNVSIIMAAVLVILVAFLICNYIASVIESECVVIGTLFSLGYSRRELCRHYISLPAIIVTFGSIVGTLCGFLFGDVFVKSAIQSYNFPVIRRVLQPYQLMLGIVFPIVFVLIINIRLLLSKLSIEPLKLLRKDIKKKSHLSYIRIKRFNFLKRFKIKEMLNNINNFFVLTLGVILTVFLMMFSLGIWSSMKNYTNDIGSEIKYNYSYYLNFTDGLRSFEDAEKINNTEMTLVLKDDNSDKIILSGIDSDCKFYNFSIADNETGVYVSTNVSQKFGINVGDDITLMDSNSKKNYSTKVKAVVESKNGLYLFMNREKMNELLGKSSDYYNMILSKDKLDIGKNYIYKEVTKDSLISDVESVMNRLIPLCILIMAISVCICIVLILILIKIQFDQSSFSVSLVGCVGYNPSEISSVYTFTIKAALATGVFIGIPLSYFIFRALWPKLIMSMSTYINVRYNWYCYLLICGMYIVCYFISLLRFRKKVKTIDYVTVMKARE